MIRLLRSQVMRRQTSDHILIYSFQDSSIIGAFPVPIVKPTTMLWDLV
jgi:hypothetical protein